MVSGVLSPIGKELVIFREEFSTLVANTNGDNFHKFHAFFKNNLITVSSCVTCLMTTMYATILVARWFHNAWPEFLLLLPMYL